jgi:hypothetical protein
MLLLDKNQAVLVDILNCIDKDSKWVRDSYITVMVTGYVECVKVSFSYFLYIIYEFIRTLYRYRCFRLVQRYRLLIHVL